MKNLIRIKDKNSYIRVDCDHYFPGDGIMFFCGDEHNDCGFQISYELLKKLSKELSELFKNEGETGKINGEIPKG